MDFSIEDNCYVNNKFIGTTVAKKITVNILNPNNEINLENKEISVQTGMIIDSIEESVPFGNFIIEKPDTEEVKEKTSFTGYDYMVKFNIPYKNRVTFPISAGDLFEDVCGQAGVEVGNTDFVNSNYMILGNPFTNNEDCRTVLSNLAQLAGGFAKIGRDNKAYIKSLKNISNLLKVKDVNAMTVKELNLTIVKMLSGGRDNADETLDGNNYLDDFAKNDKWGEVNSVILRISGTEGENTTVQDETSIQKNGLTELVIEDNYFLINEAEREKVITPLWNTLKGIEYLPFKTTYYGYPYLDSGDIIYIQDTKDIGYISYVFNHTFKYNGAYSGTIDTPAMTKTQTAYKNTINTKTKFLQVERKIDKINGEISDVIKSVDTNTKKLSSHEQTLDSITDTLSSVETTVEGTVKTVQVQYALSDSSTVAPESGWSNVAPEWQEGKYMWQKTVTIFMNDMQIESEATCIQGANGKDGTEGKDGLGIEKLETQYYLSTSNTTVTGGSWKNTQDKWTANHYIWTRTKITWSDNSVTYSEPVLAEGLNTANENANNANEGTKVVTTKMSQVEKTVDSITQTVTETTERLNNDYSTTEQTQSMIKSESDNINLSVTKKIDNIQVGGTNLIPNSAPYNLENWHTSNDTNIELTLQDEETAPFGKCLRIRTKTDLTALLGIYIIPTTKILEEGKEYCFSLWMKATANTTVTAGYVRGGQTSFNVTTQYQKFTHKFTATEPTGTSHGFAIYLPNGTVPGRQVFVHSIKLEEGNKTTAWCPAPADDVKGSQIISSINISPEDIKIKSNKIELTANDILNLLAGNTINIQSRNIKIASDNFNVDENGNLSANNATVNNIHINNGEINLDSEKNTATITLSSPDNDQKVYLSPSGISILGNNLSGTPGNMIQINTYLENQPAITVLDAEMNQTTILGGNIETRYIRVGDEGVGEKNVTINEEGYLGCDNLYVDVGGINCVGNIQAHNHIYCNNGVEPFSLAEKKRNIEKYNNKALDEVLNTDIYYYNYKEDAENIKRRVGAIIGEAYKCSKEIIGTEGKGIDLYSMISVAYKAIQEQQELIEKQNKTIENLISRVEKLEKAGEA